MGISDLEIFPGSEVRILNSSEMEHESTWKPVWGQFSSIRDHYNELVLDLESIEAYLDDKTVLVTGAGGSICNGKGRAPIV